MKNTFTLIVLSLALLASPNVVYGQGNTFVVTSKEDSGSGTFRQALTDAQSGDSITFDASVFLSDSPDTIFLTSPLPELLNGNLVVDASNAGVVIDGSRITIQDRNGLTIFSSNNVIRGLHLMNFSKAGIGLEGGAQN
ncbi:MAG: hypothetical protein R3182_03595, partial [Draconibacterium sp.]|nr:hypothetical protein [Draconibacterium sp.]